MQTHTHTLLTALCPGLPTWAGTRKVKPIWILLEQETVSGSGISWAICKSAPCSRQITTLAPTAQFFTGRMPFLSPSQQCQSTEGKPIVSLMQTMGVKLVFLYTTDVFSRALASGFSQGSEYLRLWTAYLDYLRRHIHWNEGNNFFYHYFIYSFDMSSVSNSLLQ